MKAGLSGTMCLAVLVITLSLGLWPFHIPRNNVKWLRKANGLSFGRFGTVLSSGSFDMIASREVAGDGIEVWLQPEPYRSGAFLSFFNPQESLRLSLRQSVSDFELNANILNHEQRPLEASLYVENALLRPNPVFIAITSGARGTIIYTNGIITKVEPRFQIAGDVFEGQLILGDAPRNSDSWRGQLGGVAIYDAELSASQVRRHYDSWKNDGRPNIVEDERNVALYLFDERKGKVVHNKVWPGIDLFIPERYTVVDKFALQPFWSEFEMTRQYWEAALKNVVGFVPLGFSLYLFLRVRRTNRAAIATVIIGFLVSLTIEVLQAYLPMRESGTTDILTNTLGTWIGVLACRFVSPFLLSLTCGLSSAGY